MEDLVKALLLLWSAGILKQEEVKNLFLSYCLKNGIDIALKYIYFPKKGDKVK